MRNLLALIFAFSRTGAVGNSWRVATSRSIRLQEPPVLPFQIAAPFPGETAFEMVGRVEYHESSIISFGYLSTVAGIDRSMIFSGSGSPSATIARFTYFARLNLLKHSTLGDVSVVDAEGTLTIYFTEEGGSNLNNSESFYRGNPIATKQVQLQVIRQGERTDSGVIVGEGTLTQLIDAPFSFDGDDYRFGHTGLQEQFLYSGTSISSPSGSISVVESVAGYSTVTGRVVMDDSGDVVTGTPVSASIPEANSLLQDNSPLVSQQIVTP